MSEPPETAEWDNRMLDEMLSEAPHSPETFRFAAQLGRDLAREHVEAHRADLDALLSVRCSRRRHLLASVWLTPWGAWVECSGYEPTPAGWRDIGAASDDLANTASQIASVGRYPDESGLLSRGEPDPVLATLHEVVSKLTALERVAYESLRAPAHSPQGRPRHAGCHCAVWRFTDDELSAAVDAKRRTIVLTDKHRLR